MTTHFLDETPELFDLQPARDRANRLLSFIGDTILNGNPTVAGKDHPKKLKPPPAVSFEQGSDPPPGTRQLLLELGPDRFAEWVWDRKCLLVTDTTFRDAHQSLLATRVRTYNLLGTAWAVARRLPNLFSVEMWGGATFDAALRFLYEDPWERLRLLREAIPNICSTGRRSAPITGRSTTRPSPGAPGYTTTRSRAASSPTSSSRPRPWVSVNAGGRSRRCMRMSTGCWVTSSR